VDVRPNWKERPSCRVRFRLGDFQAVLAQDDPALDALVRAYPKFLTSHDSRDLIWKDGTRMTVSDGRSDKSFEEKLSNPSILDQLSIPYIKGRPAATSPG
jgi:hypothetical protein